jgi:uncharacterized protein
MKIGIVSDSHDNVPALISAVETLRNAGAAVLLHAGDIIAPFTARVLNDFPGPVHAVYGNNDGERAGLRKFLPEIADGPLELSIGGKRILLVHDVTQVPDVSAKRVYAVVHGHTHKHEDALRGGARYINPGECGGWLYGKKTAMILDLESGETRLIEIK